MKYQSPVLGWRVGVTAILVVASFFLVACGKEKKITRVEPGVVTDLSGNWNDTDSRMVAETMVEQALSNAWVGEYTQSHKRKPTVIVGTIRNRSHEHINVSTFVNDLSRELTNSGKVDFVASKEERQELRDERKEQAVFAREDTQKAHGREIGADFMLKGDISTILDEADGTKAIFYQVDLQMINLENNIKSWYGQKKLKKVIERKRSLF